MIKVIDGADAVLGRLAAYIAKEALKGEEIAIINCEKILVTGNRNNFVKELNAKRRRVGSTQKGPKYPSSIDMLVKRTIRGMLPNARRSGRGRDALKRIKCYIGIPKEFENAKIEKMKKRQETKSNKLGDILNG
ncbi:MAG TPA: 50S ribosomal protein L13 [Patescibacteria group bacterium]|nr:50S ribosomal protein L13 [Patescibacteria group bacterium]